MFRLTIAIVFMGSLCSLRVAEAGKYNETLNIGDPVPAWKDLPGVDGKTHSLADLKDKDVVILVFTCNSCPVATDYEDRIIALAKKYAGADAKAALVAINVNKIDEDRLPKMKERSDAKGFPFPYLFDESQQIAKSYGAITTPEFFVLDRDRKVVYMGGMDDNSNPGAGEGKLPGAGRRGGACWQQAGHHRDRGPRLPDSLRATTRRRK